MREATFEEISYLDPDLSDRTFCILAKLIENRHAWHHIDFGELPGDTRTEQTLFLVNKGLVYGHVVETKCLWRHDVNDKGFFALVR